MPDARTNDDFFVGYLAPPRSTTRFVRTISIALLVLVGTVGALIAAVQQSPGDGRWDLGNWQSYTGLLIAEPYPMLRIAGRHGTHTYLLVEAVKMGAQPRIGDRAGTMIDVRAALIERDNRRMLELAPEDNALSSTAGSNVAPVSPPSPRPLGTVTLRGEIVDSKCYLGVMKPGEGKPHKACASLCIRGGIPPMLVTRSPTGASTYYLLCTTDGRRLPDEILPYVADPVEITGELEQWDDLLVLKIEIADIRRL